MRTGNALYVFVHNRLKEHCVGKVMKKKDAVRWMKKMYLPPKLGWLVLKELEKKNFVKSAGRHGIIISDIREQFPDNLMELYCLWGIIKDKGTKKDTQGIEDSNLKALKETPGI